MSTEDDILCERRGAAGVVTLNRPKALNAINHNMVRLLGAQLKAWRDDPAVTRVVVRGAGDKAFSAGGDIRQLYDLGQAGRHDEAVDFWREEYQLNAAIKRYPKPYVALIDGIVMGGGVGFSVHGSHRVAGDKFLFAMPEVGIGFAPDIGASYFLPRLPGELGMWCALTGARLKIADGVAAGIATHYVPSAKFGEVFDALLKNDPVDATIAAFAADPGPGPSVARRATIDRLFSGGRLDEVLVKLEAEAKSGSADAEWAAQTLATINTKSPTSLKLAFAQVRRGKAWSLEECLQAELRIVARVIRGHDFYEGVGAVIVHKTNAPKWRPATLDEVSDAEIERHFAPLGEGDLRIS